MHLPDTPMAHSLFSQIFPHLLIILVTCLLSEVFHDQPILNDHLCPAFPVPFLCIIFSVEVISSGTIIHFTYLVDCQAPYIRIKLNEDRTFVYFAHVFIPSVEDSAQFIVGIK